MSAHLLLKPCFLCLQGEKKKKSICVTHSEYRRAILRTIETNPQNPAKSTNNSKYNAARSCCIENTLPVLSYYEFHLTRPDLKHKTSCRASEPSLGDALVSKGGKSYQITLRVERV